MRGGRRGLKKGVGEAVTGLEEDAVGWWWCLNPKALLEVALSKVTLDQLLPSSFWSRKAHGSRDHFTSGTPRQEGSLLCPLPPSVTRKDTHWPSAYAPLRPYIPFRA